MTRVEKCLSGDVFFGCSTKFEEYVVVVVAVVVFAVVVAVAVVATKLSVSLDRVRVCDSDFVASQVHDCSTGVDHTRHDRETVGSNPVKCQAFFSSPSFSAFLSFYQWCVLISSITEVQLN